MRHCVSFPRPVSRSCCARPPASLPSRRRGFTLVELIVTILLTSIIAAAVIPRMMGSRSYYPVVVQSQVVAMLRSAQQKAIGHGGVKLQLQPQAGNSKLEIRITADPDETLLQIAEVPYAGVLMSIDVDELESCEGRPALNPVTAATPGVLEFVYPGDLLRAGTGTALSDVNKGLRLCLNGDQLHSVCVSAAGFATEGNCP
jgi:prepilin-type N-terminal cleavage/methylation domain-containing protein